MTQVTIIGENNKQKIEFIKVFTREGYWDATELNPSDYKFIELISRNYTKNNIVLDLMFAHNSERHYGLLYLGHFNDGIV